MFDGLFDFQSRLDKIDRNGDPLVALNNAVDWELFRPELEATRERVRKSTAGRKPYDAVLMFKTLVLQSLFNLSDAGTERQILDRLSFHRFLGLSFGQPVPDANTIWLFREALNAGDKARTLFDRFNAILKEKGYEAKKGQIIDASIVEVPVQRNTREENDLIKKGEAEKVRAGWKPAKAAQKDTDARWTQKNGQNHYGYKHHDNVDAGHKLIREYSVTPANVHDSREFAGLLAAKPDTGTLAAVAPTAEAVPAEMVNTETGAPVLEVNAVASAAGVQVVEKPAEPDMADVYADSAYRSVEHETLLFALGLRSHVMMKGSRHRKLAESERAANHLNSKVRVRVEHVFGAMRQRMGVTVLRTIGLLRAKTKLGLRALAYNIDRFAFLTRDTV